jgi:hypothetical protein
MGGGGLAWPPPYDVTEESLEPRLFGRVGPATCRRRRIERGVGVTEIARRAGVVPPDLNEVAAGNAKRSGIILTQINALLTQINALVAQSL